MRKLKIFFLGVVVLIGLWLVMLHFEQPVIEAEVNENATQVLINANFQSVQVFNANHGRDLTLSGIVRNQQALDDAISIAARSYGVRVVDGSAIELKQFKPPVFNLEFEKGKVSVSGVVQSDAMVTQLNEVSRGIKEGFFNSSLKVDNDIAAPVWVDMLSKLLTSFKNMDNGKLQIVDGKGEISGMVRSQAQLDSVKQSMDSSNSNLQLDFTKIVVRPEQSDIVLQIKDGIMYISGKVKALSVHADLMASVKRVFDKVDASGFIYSEEVGSVVTWAEDIDLIIEVLSKLEAPDIVFSSKNDSAANTNQISGIVRTQAVKSEIDSLLKSLSDNTSINSDIAFRPWLAPHLQIALAQSGLSVSGQLSDDFSSRRVLTELKKISSYINDQNLVFNEDVTEAKWLESVLSSIAGLRYLKDARLSAGESGISMQGVAETDQQYQSLIAALSSDSTNTNLIGELGLKVDVLLLDEKICLDKIKKGLQNNTIEFETESHTIDQQSFSFLDGLVDIVESCTGIMFEITGHTDNAGADSYNLPLSNRRAEAVVQYMVAAGVADELFRTKGYGSSVAIADNDTEEGRALNRRIEVNVIITR